MALENMPGGISIQVGNSVRQRAFLKHVLRDLKAQIGIEDTPLPPPVPPRSRPRQVSEPETDDKLASSLLNYLQTSRIATPSQKLNRINDFLEGKVFYEKRQRDLKNKEETISKALDSSSALVTTWMLVIFRMILT